MIGKYTYCEFPGPDGVFFEDSAKGFVLESLLIPFGVLCEKLVGINPFNIAKILLRPSPASHVLSAFKIAKKKN